jgi:hypothetical protein
MVPYINKITSGALFHASAAEATFTYRDIDGDQPQLGIRATLLFCITYGLTRANSNACV